MCLSTLAHVHRQKALLLPSETLSALGNAQEWVFVALNADPLRCRANSANTEAANTNLPEHTEFAATDTKMRRRLTLAAAMLQSTCALQPLVQRCCAESLAGCAGGLAKQLAVYPLDRAATRLETKKGAKATNVQQAYRGAGVLMLFALPYAIAFHVPFVLVENALPVGDAAARASIAGFLAALAAAPVGVPAEACKRPRPARRARERSIGWRPVALRRLLGDGGAERAL